MDERTPRRGSVHAPQTPGELNIVSRVGLSASADGTLARGILCVKLGIPRDASGASWALFSGPTPTLRSIPALYPLPIAPSLRASHNLLTAASLLNLPCKAAYPPSTDPGVNPRLETLNGQVFVIVDESPRRIRARRESVRDRAEFLAIIEFEVPVAHLGEIDSFYSAVIPVPKCLDNNLKFQMVGNDEDEVSVVADPKVLPNPRGNLFHTRIEDGWEDGEVPGAESEASDDEGSWLEGRFPSTDTLKLQWSFVPSLDAPPDLRVVPKWDNKCPSITIAFEAGIPATGGPLGIEAVLPPDWGWRDIAIRGDGLRSWKSTDEDLASVEVEVGDISTATELPPSPSIRPPRARALPLDASRLEDLNIDELAPLDDSDFSFNDSNAKPITPATPRRRQVENTRSECFRVTPRVPLPAGLFELEFAPSTPTVDSDDDDERRVLLVEGTLVPLPRVLVGPDAPVSLPFIRFDSAALPTSCSVNCPNASFEGEDSRLRSTAGSCVGAFSWSDENGNAVPRRATLPIAGPVRVVAQRNIWGVQTVLVSLNWPPRAAEVSLAFTVPLIRVISAVAQTSQGASDQLMRAVLPRENGAEVRVAGGRGTLDLILEVADDGGVAIPLIPDGTGEVKVELAGEGWDKLLAHEPLSSMKRVSDRGFVGTLEERPSIAFGAPRKRAKFVSWPVIANLVLLWVLVSLAVQVQNLRAQVAFVVDEARDLRLYGFEQSKKHTWRECETKEREREDVQNEPQYQRQHSVHVPNGPDTDPPEPPEPQHTPHTTLSDDFDDALPTATSVDTHDGLGRVVFGHSWTWTSHPV